MGIAVLISVLFTIAAVIARNQVKDGGGESDIFVASQLRRIETNIILIMMIMMTKL